MGRGEKGFWAKEQCWCDVWMQDLTPRMTPRTRNDPKNDDDRMVRVNMECSGLTWAEIICRFVKGDAGLSMAYIGEEGINVNSLPDKFCAGTGTITFMNDTQEVHEAKAIHCHT